MMSGYTRQIVNGICKYVIDSYDKSDWANLALEADARDLIVDHDRLLRSLSWRDDDYGTCVIDVIPQVLERSGAITKGHLDLDGAARLFPGLVGYLREKDPKLHEMLLATREGLPAVWADGPGGRGQVKGDEGPRGGSDVDVAPKKIRPVRLNRPVGLAEGELPFEENEPAKDDIFLVHGHDDAFKNEVFIWISRVTGKHPIVLQDEESLGKTIVEKLEKAATRARFAVILLTPDDVGAAKKGFAVAVAGAKSPEDVVQLLDQRSRENVVFEWGMFCGLIGRENTAAINRGVRVISDLGGVVYIPDSDWKERLRTEFRAAGITLLA